MTAEMVMRDNVRKDLIDCVSPSTRQKLGTVRVDSPDEIRAIVRRARQAQPQLAKASHEKRRRVLERVLGQMLDHALVEFDVFANRFELNLFAQAG